MGDETLNQQTETTESVPPPLLTQEEINKELQNQLALLKKENERLRTAYLTKATDAQRKRAGAASCPHCLEQVTLKGENHQPHEFGAMVRYGLKRPVGEVHGSPGEIMRCPTCDQLFVHGEEFVH